MRWWALRLPEQTRARFVASVFLAGAHLLLCAAYAIPGVAITRALVGQPDQVSIVNTIDQYGPFWVIGYGMSGVALAAAVFTRRLLSVAHLIGLVVVGAYDVAVWWGTFASEPNRSVVTGMFVGGWAVWHMAMMFAYTDELVKGVMPAWRR